MNKPSSNIRFNYLMLLPIFLATFFSFHGLGTHSFWLDEADSVIWAKSNWPQFWGVIIRGETNMTTYYVLLKIWISFFGESEFLVRTLSVIFGIASVALVSIIGQRLFGNKTGLMAALLLSVNPFFIQYAQEARGYTLTLFFVCLSFYLLIQVIEFNQYRYYIAYSVVNTLVLYSHYLALFVLIAQLLFVYFLPPQTIHRKRIFVSWAAALLLTIPLGFLMLNGSADNVDWIQKTNLMDVYRLFLSFSGESRKLLLCYFIPTTVLCLLIALKPKTSEHHLHTWKYSLILCWLFVPILGILLLSVVKPMFVPRYMFFSLPALTLLVGTGLSLVKRDLLLTIVSLFVLALSLQSLFNNYYPIKKSDWRAVATYIAQNAQQGDALLIYDKLNLVPFEYYYDIKNVNNVSLVSVYPSPYGSTYEEIKRMGSLPSIHLLESLAQKYDRLWLVRLPEMIDLKGKAIIPVIEKHYLKTQNVLFDTQLYVGLYQAKKEK